MKIPLTKGKFALVDKEDFERVNQFKWHIFSQKGYAGRDDSRKNGKKKITMHRFIMGNPKGLEIDHINRNPLDNRKKNLRVVTHQQNSFNHPGYGHRGITKVTNRPLKKPYCVRLMIGGKNLYLGYYKTLKEARRAWKDGAKKYYGGCV